MNQIVGGVYTEEVCVEGGRIKNIADGDFGVCTQAMTQSFGMTRKAAYAMARGFQGLEEAAADVTRGAGKKN